MATSSQFNLLVNQGSTFSQTFALLDSQGEVLDLSAYQIRGQFRKTYASTTSYSITTSVLDVSNGIIELSLAAAFTESIKCDRYVYDIEIFDDEAETVHRILQGEVEFTPEVTRL